MMKDFLRKITPQFLWDLLRSFKIRRGIEQFSRRVVEHSFCGYPLKVLIADGVGEGWYDKDWDRLEEIDLLASGNLRPGATIFDLGAHQGVVAMIMAKIVGESGRVIAVEGTKHNCDVANENLRINEMKNVTVHHAVIADQDGQIRFFDGLNGNVSEKGSGRVVEAITIDSLTRKYGAPDVIFVDIEGFEEKSLQGSIETIGQDIDWFIEVHVACGLESYGGSAQGVLSYFPNEKYERYVWNLDTEQKPQPLGSESPVLGRRFALVAMRRNDQS